MQVVKVCQPLAAELMRYLAIELVGPIAQSIATIDVSDAVRGHRGVGMRIHIDEGLTDRIDARRGNDVAGKVSAVQRVLDASAAGADSIGYDADLREVTSALFIRGYDKCVGSCKRRALPIAFFSDPEERLMSATQKMG